MYQYKLSKYSAKIEDISTILDDNTSYVDKPLSDLVINDNYNDDNSNLYILFITSKLLEKTQIIETFDEPKSGSLRKRSRNSKSYDELETEKNTQIKRKTSFPKKYDNYITSLTPYIKKYVDPSTIDDIEADLKLDDKLIEKIESYEDDNYVDIENYGKHVEVWFADNFVCPVCRQYTLRRYAKSNFPVIDLVCVNNNHTFSDGVRFFQVKAMAQGSLFNGLPYFSRNDRTIHVGSYTYGKIVHNLSRYDFDVDKKILIGYMCIVIKRILEDSLIIDKTKSFFVLPKTNTEIVAKKLFNDIPPAMLPIHDDVYFYQYLDEDDDAPHLIKFSNLLNDVTTLSSYVDSNIVIPKNYLSNVTHTWKELSNPLNIFT